MDEGPPAMTSLKKHASNVASIRLRCEQSGVRHGWRNGGKGHLLLPRAGGRARGGCGCCEWQGHQIQSRTRSRAPLGTFLGGRLGLVQCVIALHVPVHRTHAPWCTMPNIHSILYGIGSCQVWVVGVEGPSIPGRVSGDGILGRSNQERYSRCKPHSLSFCCSTIWCGLTRIWFARETYRTPSWHRTG